MKAAMLGDYSTRQVDQLWYHEAPKVAMPLHAELCYSTDRIIMLPYCMLQECFYHMLWPTVMRRDTDAMQMNALAMLTECASQYTS